MRRYRPLSDFEQAIIDMREAQRHLEAAVAELRSHHLEDLFCHADNIIDRRLPELVAWSTRMHMEAIEQCRSAAAGRKSQAEKVLDRAAAAAAKAGIKKKGLQASRDLPPKSPPAKTERRPKS